MSQMFPICSRVVILKTGLCSCCKCFIFFSFFTFSLKVRFTKFLLGWKWGFFKTSKFFLVGQRRDKAVQDKHVPVGNSISYMLNILLSGCISRCGISIQIISWCWQTCFGLHDAAKSEFVKVCFYYFREILSRKHWYFLLAKTKNPKTNHLDIKYCIAPSYWRSYHTCNTTFQGNNCGDLTPGKLYFIV